MHIAQLNIARARAALDGPLLKEFMDNLDPINAIADSSPGFIWRLEDESSVITGINLFDDPQLIINMSVWESVDVLREFMFKTHHVNFLKRRHEWFEKMPVASYVLWWIAEGHIPTLEEAKERLLMLREEGESPLAFSLKRAYQQQDDAETLNRAMQGH